MSMEALCRFGKRLPKVQEALLIISIVSVK
jgi:hypothetical protein